MKRRFSFRAMAHLLAPTAVGTLVYMGITLVVAGMHSTSSIRSVLQVPSDAKLDIGQGVLNTVNKAMVEVLGDHANTLALAVLWGLVGLAAYMLVQGAAGVVRELRLDVQARRYVWTAGSNRNQPLEHFLIRGAVRLAVFAVLVIYGIYAVAYVTDWQVGTGMPWERAVGGNSVAQFVYLAVVSLGVWHGLTVLLRLLALRPRLFGTDYINRRS